MLRRNAIVTAICAILLAMGIACDSSSSGGGGAATTGYTQADLAGIWHVRVSVTGKSTVKYDDQGHYVWWQPAGGDRYSNWTGELTVSADGTISGTVIGKMTATVTSVAIYTNVRFQNKDLITGSFVSYNYVKGVGKVDLAKHSLRLTRYGN